MRIRNIVIAVLGAMIVAGCAYDDYGYGYDEGYGHHHHHWHDRDDGYWNGGYGH